MLHARTGKAPGSKPSRVRRLPTRTKIVATLGPATATVANLRALIRAGADVFRLNFSHGTHVEHGQAIRRVRSAAKAEGGPVALLADLQGPKIRVGNLVDDEPIELRRGGELAIVASERVVGKPGRIGCTYRGLARDVQPGDRVLLDDGGLELAVERVEGSTVYTRVRYGGLLYPHKGINLPGTKVKAPSLGKKDLADLEFALRNGVDFVALSFVRTAREILRLRKKIREFGADADIIAKIERPEAVTNIDSIIAATDGIMIARGDMGVELGPEAVPSIQKRIIRLCVEAGKPVITATQMLETMISHPRPTRAEASDVANAIYDGTSAVMLSGETAVGKYPALTVRTMDSIARRTEREIFDASLRHPIQRIGDLRRNRRTAVLSISEAAVSAAARAALEAGANLIATLTETGRTARLMSRERLHCRLVAFTPSYRTYRKLALNWGIFPVLTRRVRTVEQMYRLAQATLVTEHHAHKGDRVVFLAGNVDIAGATNTVMIRELGCNSSELPKF